MSVLDAFACIILGGAMALLVGHSFLDTFFKRKEEIINRLTEKGDV